MRKVVAYIIPGLDETSGRSGYRAIADTFRKENIKPVIVDVGWKQRTITSYVKKLADLIEPASFTCLFGFSLGAMVALVAAGKLKTDHLILCSLSPYFKEDRSHLTGEDKRTLGKRKINDFNNYSFLEVAKHVRCRTVILAGSEESKLLLKRCEIAQHEIKHAQLKIIREANHSIDESRYQRSINAAIAQLGRILKSYHHGTIKKKKLTREANSADRQAV
jgi:pimeloyl-ACP methyl ester carboxylesterase